MPQSRSVKSVVLNTDWRRRERAKVGANVLLRVMENKRPPVPWRPSMQMIIEARLVDDVQETARIQLAVIDREMTTSPLGLSLAEGKALLASAQQYLVRAQWEGIGAAHAHCESCRAELIMKGCHERQIRTVFGRVKVRSPRVRFCSCAGRPPGALFSPLTRVVPTCMTPELEYLQVK